MKAFFFFVALACVCYAQELGKYNVDPSAIVTSGISSGGFFAVQMFVAYSSTFKAGVAVEAGGPYYCAKGMLTEAETACMSVPSGIMVSTLVSDTKKFASSGDIDDVSNMANGKVYLFSGTKDTVVRSGVVDKTKEYFTNFLPEGNIHYENSIAAEHAWITDSFKNTCSHLGSPYMNDCDYDSAGIQLQWIFGTLNPRVTQNSSNIFSFDQSKYTSGTPKSISMGTTGYAYIPTACQDYTECKLIVVFHGCSQTINDIGSDMYTKTGLNEWAESNNIIVLYPQVIKSTMNPSNPEGCFDWWGYTDSLTSNNYAKKNGPQMAAVYNMVKAVAGL